MDLTDVMYTFWTSTNRKKNAIQLDVFKEANALVSKKMFILDEALKRLERVKTK